MPLTFGKAAQYQSQLQLYLLELNALRWASNRNRLEELDWQPIGIQTTETHATGETRIAYGHSRAEVDLVSPVREDTEAHFILHRTTTNTTDTIAIERPGIGAEAHILDQQGKSFPRVIFDLSTQPPAAELRSTLNTRHMLMPYDHQFNALLASYKTLRTQVGEEYDRIKTTLTQNSGQEPTDAQIMAQPLQKDASRKMDSLFLMGTGSGKTIAIAEALASAGGEGFLIVPNELLEQTLTELRRSFPEEKRHLVANFTEVANATIPQKQAFYEKNNIIVVGFDQLESALALDQDGTPILNNSIVLIDEVHQALAQPKHHHLLTQLREHNLVTGVTASLTRETLEFFGDVTVGFMFHDLMEIKEVHNRPRFLSTGHAVLPESHQDAQLVHAALVQALAATTFRHPEANRPLPHEDAVQLYQDPWDGLADNTPPTPEAIVAAVKNNRSRLGDFRGFIFATEKMAPRIHHALQAIQNDRYPSEAVEALARDIAEWRSKQSIAEALQMQNTDTAPLNRTARMAARPDIADIDIQRDDAGHLIGITYQNDPLPEAYKALVIPAEATQPKAILEAAARINLANRQTIRAVSSALHVGEEDIEKLLLREQLHAHLQERETREHKAQGTYTHLITAPESIDASALKNYQPSEVVKKSASGYENVANRMREGALQFIITAGADVASTGVNILNANLVVETSTPQLPHTPEEPVPAPHLNTTEQQLGRAARARTLAIPGYAVNLLRPDQLQGARMGIDRPTRFADIMQPDYLQKVKARVSSTGLGPQYQAQQPSASRTR